LTIPGNERVTSPLINIHFLLAGNSNLVSTLRQQLMSYINVYRFLEDPEESLREIIKENKFE